MLASRFGRLVVIGVALAAAGSTHSAETDSVELPADLQRVLEAHEAAWQAEYERILSILSTLDEGPIWLQGAAIPERYQSSGQDLHLWALQYTIDDNHAYIVTTYGYGDRAASQDNGQYLLAVERNGPSEPWLVPDDLANNAGPPGLPPPPFSMPTPEGWHAEMSRLPPAFAPDLPHDGFEASRFAPGMFEPGAEDFWSYAFVWWLEPESVFTAESLSGELADYFRGLAAMILEARAVSPLEPSFRAELAELDPPSDSRRFEGVVETLDASVTLEQMTLNAEIEIFDCADQGRIAAFFKLSPQPRGHAVWSALQSVRDGFRCLR